MVKPWLFYFLLVGLAHGGQTLMDIPFFQEIIGTWTTHYEYDGENHVYEQYAIALIMDGHGIEIADQDEGKIYQCKTILRDGKLISRERMVEAGKTITAVSTGERIPDKG